MSKDYSLSLRGEAFNSLCADSTPRSVTCWLA